MVQKTLPVMNRTGDFVLMVHWTGNSQDAMLDASDIGGLCPVFGGVRSALITPTGGIERRLTWELIGYSKNRVAPMSAARITNVS